MQVGAPEHSAEHKEILRIFNSSGLCPRYKMTEEDAWCATAVSSAFIATGNASIFPCVECSCYYMMEKAKAAGLWVEDDGYIPTPGDVVLYDWQDTGVGDNQGHPDHVGIVSSVNASTIVVVEGNKDDKIGTRRFIVNSKYIRGFIRPKYNDGLGWHKDAEGWWYRHSPGTGPTTYYHDCFQRIGGRLYCFDSDGYISYLKRVLPTDDKGWL